MLRRDFFKGLLASVAVLVGLRPAAAAATRPTPPSVVFWLHDCVAQLQLEAGMRGQEVRRLIVNQRVQDDYFTFLVREHMQGYVDSRWVPLFQGLPMFVEPNNEDMWFVTAPGCRLHYRKLG
jgi:hypothetical protein